MILKLVLAWIVAIVGFGISIYFIIRSIVFSRSLFRDAPYVSTSRSVTKQALELLSMKKGDNFIDIGSGNGYSVFQAATMLKGEGTFTGIEISRWLVFVSNFLKLFNPYRKSISFIAGDMFKQDYSSKNRVFLFLTTDLLEKLTPKLEKELPKGSTVVSIMFKFPDEFMKTHNIETKTCKMWGKTCSLYLWRK